VFPVFLNTPPEAGVSAASGAFGFKTKANRRTWPAMTTEKVDLVLHEGVILGHPESDSVAILDGRIFAHGKFADLKAHIGPRTHLLKLQGRSVVPGFIDSHVHFLESASAATGATLWRCRTLGDLLGELRLAAGRTPPGNWIRAFGCDETLLQERRGPTRAELDQSVPKNPLRLRHQTLHASWLNSRAIKALGIEDPAFKPPEGAVIYRDATGRATGFVVGMEQWITSKLPLVTAAEAEARARIMSRELCAVGVTAFTDATARNDAAQVSLFGGFVSSGAICQRVALMLGARHLDSAESAFAAARKANLRIAGAKFLPGRAGYDRRTLRSAVRRALSLGMDCAFHATEIEELDAALEALEGARADTANDPRALAAVVRIEHGGVIPPDYIERLRAVGAWVVTNPGFIYYRGAKYAEEPGLLPHLYRLRSLAEAGIPLAAGTDSPVTPARPLAAIAAAISRTALEGMQLGAEESIGAAEAFSLFNAEAARLARLEAGTMRPGALADLVVLPADPLRVPPADLMSMAVDITLVGGRIVYERGRPAVANSASADLLSS
jgi:predicted amidohydrolase YtcJ